MQRTYKLSTPAAAAESEWRKFEHRDPFVRSLADVRFNATDSTHSELAICTAQEVDHLALDAAVERFRSELARKGLSGEAAAGNPGARGDAPGGAGGTFAGGSGGTPGAGGGKPGPY